MNKRADDVGKSESRAVMVRKEGVHKRILDMTIDFLNNSWGIGRQNFVLVRCNAANSLQDTINQFKAIGVNSVNIGRELSEKIETIESSKFLGIESQEYLQELIEKHAVQIVPGKPKVVAIYNLGILLEPSLSLNTASLLKEFSKNLTIIVLWDHVYSEGLLHWGVQQEQYQLNLSDIYIAEGITKYDV
jgi:hypothetical protein